MMEKVDEQLLLHADKHLFAADLVDHVIIKTRPSFGDKTANILARVDNLRNFTYNRFNKTIKKALSIIDVNQDNSVFKDFEEIMKSNKVNKETFKAYGFCFRKCKLADGFNAKSFLMYCDRIANMAGYFLSCGVDDAPEVAVELIMEAFPTDVLYSGTWNKLTKVAATLEVLGNDYYGDDMSSDSNSEQEDVISSENEDSSANSVNMDVNEVSPEDLQQQNLDIASSILAKTSRISNINNDSLRTNARPIFLRKAEFVNKMDCQSSENTSSSTLSSFKYSSPASPEEVDIASSFFSKTSGNINDNNESSSTDIRPVNLPFTEFMKAIYSQPSDRTSYVSNDASPASPEKNDVSNS